MRGEFIELSLPNYWHEFEWIPGVGDGQGGLVCCDSWGHKESDMTDLLNWTELKLLYNTTYPLINIFKYKNI